MANFSWNGGNGLFSSPGLWNPAGPPGSDDVASFGFSSGAVLGVVSVDARTVATLRIAPNSLWTWSGALTAGSFLVDGTSTLSAGAVWTLKGSPSASQYLVVGSGAGGQGSLSLTGVARIASMQTASTSAYALYVGSGSAAESVGVLFASGSGVSIDTGLNGAAVGQAGSGKLSVDGGASATFSSSDSSQIAALAVARDSGSSGAVSVSGVASTLSASGFVYLGRAGAATLLVAGGATFTGGVAPAGATTYGISVGAGTGAGSSTAYFGGTGVATVSGGGVLHSLSDVAIGQNGSTGTVVVDGMGSQVFASRSIEIGTGSARAGGKGTLTVRNGGVARSGTPATGSAGIAIGATMGGETGTATVDGVGSLLDANGYRLSIGTADLAGGQTVGADGSLSVSNGGRVLSGAAYSDVEAALAVGAVAGGTGTLTVAGAGSKLVATGEAVIGGRDSGKGVVAGGTGTVSVSAGGTLQTQAMFIERGSSVSVDAASTLAATAVTIDGGTLSLAVLTSALPVSFGSGGTLAVASVSGSVTVGNFAAGDVIDVVGLPSATVSGSTIAVGAGSLVLSPTAGAGSYQTASDGHGGTLVSLTPQTIGVYRFFEQGNGTHFYTNSQSEAQSILSTRPDLSPETNGFGAYQKAAGDPVQEQVFRFFDQVHGTEFLTASSTEASGLMTPGSATYRTDLTFESSSAFFEDSVAKPGDVAVYRFFDKVYGTHFYTGDAVEHATLTTPGSAGFRADLVDEGVGFYAPSGTYSLVAKQ